LKRKLAVGGLIVAVVLVAELFTARKSEAASPLSVEQAQFAVPLNRLLQEVSGLKAGKKINFAHPPIVPPSAVAIEEGNSPDLPAGDPIAEGLDPLALQRLLDRATEEHSGAVLIMRHGKLVAFKGSWDQKIYAMSATKSVVSLAVGRLIDDGRIRSLDQPVSDFFPEWKEGEKSKITIRMLLNHTSGLDTNRGLGPEGTVAWALKSPLIFPPGTAFTYNNNAVDLLSGVIEKASGERADLYIAGRFFEPLGISDWDWGKDAVGTPLTAGELIIRPVDLAKIGQMVLDGGVWNGLRIVSRRWLDLSAEASQPFDPGCGLLWWRDADIRSIALTPRLLDIWGRAGVRTELLELLRPLAGRSMKNSAELKTAISTAFRDHPEYLQELEYVLMRGRLQSYEVMELGPVEGFSARGWLGQFLVIDRKRGLVGIRMRHARPGDYENPVETDGFRDFPQLVHQLAPAS
jgi:CubicO group peptidase (beta-lactamase class C family)